jgi:hypothetical protein
MSVPGAGGRVSVEAGQGVIDLVPAALDAVAEADRPDAAELDGGPRVHGVRVRVVQEQGVGPGDRANVPAEVEYARDIALSVHDAAGAEGVSDALVHAIL